MHPAPVRFLLQEHADWFAKCVSDVGGEGIDSDEKIQRLNGRGQIHGGSLTLRMRFVKTRRGRPGAWGRLGPSCIRSVTRQNSILRYSL